MKHHPRNAKAGTSRRATPPRSPAVASWLAATLLVAAPATALERIEVDSSRGGFVSATSRLPFRPWGFNYDHDEASRLLEDYWSTEWDKVAADFEEMRDLGANTVRIHLEAAKVLSTPDEVSPAAIAAIRRILALAERCRLYLDVTGLGCYRKSDVPAWYDKLTEAGRWAAQARFWEAVASACAPSPAVFCYDLMNEPVVPGGRRAGGDWLGPPFAGMYHYVQMVTLDQAGRPRADVARAWVRSLSSVIRARDPGRLITVGMVDWSLDRPGLTSGFVPSAVAPEMDFVSVHLYPESGKLAEALATLRGFDVGVPVVIEETHPLRTSSAEFRQFLRESAGTASGWFDFYWGRTPAEYRRSAELPEQLAGAWLEIFVEEMQALAADSRPRSATDRAP